MDCIMRTMRRQRVWIGLSLVLVVWVLLVPRGGHTSGSTQVSKSGEYYRLTLATPSKIFRADPETGESGEAEYHHSEKKRFEELLVTHAKWVEKNIAVIRKEFDAVAKLVPYRAEYPALSTYL